MYKLITIALCGLATVAAGAEMHPFTRVAYIPAGVDAASIRFESIQAVKVATRTVTTADQRYCEAILEPGGSMFCPATKDDSPAPAYRVTYSYRGPAVGPDYSGDSRFTFSVTLRPEELDSAMRSHIAEGRNRRGDLAGYFKVTATQDVRERTVIDSTASTFCEGRYVDGSFVRSSPGCTDRVSYTTATVPSGYLRVKVDLSASVLGSN